MRGLALAMMFLGLCLLGEDAEKKKGLDSAGVVGDEISRKHIGKTWESSFRWNFDYRNHHIRDGETVIFKEISDQSEEIIPKEGPTYRHFFCQIYLALSR